MPIIGAHLESELEPLIIASRRRDASILDTETAIEASVVARRRRAATVAGSFVKGGSVVANRARAALSSIVGRVNLDANVFGAINAARSRAALMLANTRKMGTIGAARNRAAASSIGSTTVAAPESDSFLVLLTVEAAGSRGGLADPGFVRRYGARISADGVNYPIKSYNFEKPVDELGVSLSFALVNPRDRAAILAAKSYKFELFGGDSGGLPAWKTMFDSGRRSGSNYAFAWKDGRTADELSVSTISPMSERLERSPENELTVYDPERVDLDASDFAPTLSQDGDAITHELQPVPGLTLYGLFDLVFVNYCGFAAVESTIEDFRIRRADFDPTGTYLDGVATHIGAFKPFFKVVGETLWILDGTARFPAGFGTPGQLKSDGYVSVQFAEQELNLDGFIVQYADDETGYDYISQRVVPGAIQEFGDSPFADNYMTVQTFITYREYWRNEDPTTPIRTEKIQDKTVTRASVNGSIMQDVLTETENFTYDGTGLILRIEKTLFGLAPSLGGGTFAQTIRTTKTWFTYSPDRFAPRRKFLREKREEITGLVAIDNENLHLGKPFVQDFTEANSAGNLREGMELRTRPIRTTVETTTQTGKGQSEMKTRVTDFLTSPPQNTGSTTDARGGDGSTNDQTGTPIRRRVLRPGLTGSPKRLAVLSVMEIPWPVAEALALRRLAQTKTQRGPLLLKGLKTEIDTGKQFELFDRAGNLLGLYLVEGLSISGQNLGTSAQTTRQTLMITRV